MIRDSPCRRLVPLAVVTVLAVAVSACSEPSTPSAHAGAGAARPTTTSSAAARQSTAPSAAPVPTTAAPATPELSFSPFTATGGVAQDLQVAQQVSGSCTGPGVAGAASYRCTAQHGGAIYDPCFAPPRATKGPLLCVPDPSVTDITRFAVGALPPASKAAPQKSVWAVRLQNGEVCVHVNAAWDGRGPYACPTPSATNVVADCHSPTQIAHGWTVECQATQSASSPFNAVAVVNVWN
ncbi:MAG TPA: hypothetical protein VHX67_04120 [Acidimicrobiales bacterium]|nr:hypothetical protein [Acidimicrobiales bacterium]